MSNKKSRKLINIMMSAIMLMGSCVTVSYAEDAPKAKNGIAYVLLSPDISNSPGVYRFNLGNGDVMNPTLGSPLFTVSDLIGSANKDDIKISGLAANQKNQIFLFKATKASEDSFKDADPGWLPNMTFPDDSPIYVSAAKPDDFNAKEYIRSGCPHGPYGSPFPSNDSSQYVFWYKDVTLAGNTYKYVCRFNGPNGVRYLNSKDGLRGTPIWDGTYKSDANSTNSSAIKHPKDEKKIILPSHFGAVCYYLYATTSCTKYPLLIGKPMDGGDYLDADGNLVQRPLYELDKTNGAGVFPGDSTFESKHLFACIVKHIYQKRENPLDLYCGDDTTTGAVPVGLTLKEESKKVLNSIDVKVKEAYGKICGDNCITGGAPPDNTAIAAMSKVNVVTSTTGRRYGFNPLGVFFNPKESIDASLRVVEKGKPSQTIDIATDVKGEYFNNVITNKDYLVANGVTPATIKTIGVSSNFSKGTNYDFIYGSSADKFVVQDSWWGVGGLAYEYYKETEENPTCLKKIDYVNNNNPVAEVYTNQLTGKVDSIAIDGDGFLYALKTAEEPTDLETTNANDEISAGSIDPEKAISTVSFSKYTEPISVQVETPTKWIRETIIKNGSEETLVVEEIPNGQQKPGDYKNITLMQNVYKTVKRYAPADGGIGEEEDRGHMKVGFDNWRNRLEVASNNSIKFSYPFWIQEEENARISNLEAELAVVNIADSPIEINGTTNHYITVITEAENTPNYKNTTINEDEEFEFKVEGYKPKKVDGKDPGLKTIGDIYDDNGNPFLAGVELNTNPNTEGKYEHDEDGDSFASGFPSSMFEAKDYATEITWYFAQVENTTAVNLINESNDYANKEDLKLVNDIEKFKGTGSFLSHKYQFKQPGRYIIQAHVTYNYFSNLGTADRPAQLQIAQKSFITEPLLLSVYANDLNLNNSPSYITNISMTFDNKRKNLDDSEKADDEDLTCLEDNEFGDITISFDAQFYRDKYNNDTGNYEVYDGIGVWDYDYYTKLYNRAKKIANLKGIIDPDIASTTHVYNYGSGREDDLENSFVTTILNPGKVKTTTVESRSALAGTQVDKTPNSKDMKFIQWALYLRKTANPEDDVVQTDGFSIVDRGELITSGTFEKVDLEKCEEIDARKYHISYTIPQENTNKIRTPRDPKDYTLDLEIIYPRVTWLNNDLNDKIDNKKGQYSSVVPYLDAEDGGNGPSPIHVISMLKTNSSGKLVNQNFSKSGDGISSLYAIPTGETDPKPPIVKLCVRDKEIPTLEDKSQLTQKLPRTETTGDPSDSADFECEIKDNNPFLSGTYIAKKQIKQIEDDEAKSIPVLALQSWDDESKIRYGIENDNRKYVVRKVPAGNITVVKSSTGAQDTYFALDDTWRFNLNYTMTVNPLAPDYFKPSSSNNGEITIAEKKNLKPENWIGSLYYGIVGKVCDGQGKDGKKTLHHFYNKDIYTNNIGIDQEGLDVNEAYEVSTAQYLERIDNDPPSIEVELVSQNDNRRWVFQLIEGINDRVCYPQKVSDLAPSTLVVKNLLLKNINFDDTEQAYATYPTATVPG
ncbi:MAG: hypothetical protein IKO19_09930, partial [Candidatus Riflebacteria bacterium]|nr:hypothetical protein [Candidatus Riflebacteria bacterium]